MCFEVFNEFFFEKRVFCWPVTLFMFLEVKAYASVLVGPSHHGMARPQVADR
jgi:hypothetical protein